MTIITITLPPEAEKVLREKALAAGVSLEVYLRQLAEKDVVNGSAPRAKSPTFEEMTDPFARAVEATGMTDDELGDFIAEVVDEVRAEKRAGK